MPTVISFISRKGGCGKTTNAINTATTLFENGFKTILIETDTNFTLSTIRKMELFKYGEEVIAKSLHVVGSHESNVAEDIAILRKRKSYDFIVVDNAGKTTDNGTKELCLASDIVVIPTGLTQSELLVAYQTIQDLKPACTINKKLKIVVLPNRIHPRTSVGNIMQALKKLEAEVILPFIPAKVSYTQMSTIFPKQEYKSIVECLIKQKLYVNKVQHTKRPRIVPRKYTKLSYSGRTSPGRLSRKPAESVS